MTFHSANAVVSVNGVPIPAELESRLYSTVVENGVHHPDMFELTFSDEQHDAVQKGGLQIGAVVEIKVASDASAGGVSLFKGKVTGIEIRYEPAVGSTTVMRGFDPSHVLLHGRHTQAYKNVSASDVARKVASLAKLSPVEVDSSSPVYDHVIQAASSDWQFLQGLADEAGFEMGWVNGKFKFGKPTEASTGPAPGDLQSTNPLQLVLGGSLMSIRAAVSASEQVAEVSVRGWDMKTKRAVVGKGGPPTTKSTANTAEAGEMASKFGNSKMAIGAVVDKQATALALAKSITAQIADAAVELDGIAIGNPVLRAGTAVSLGNCGKPFDGKYVLSTTRHVIDAEGYQTFFTVSGRQGRSLYGLVSGGAGAIAPSPNPRVAGVVIAIVTDVNDPDKLGRIKLQFPWLDDNYESDWARVAQAGAGNQYGLMVMPEVHDEVLVAFEHGDVRRPFVLGGLYNGKDKPHAGPTALVDPSGKVDWRGIYSRTGHMIALVESTAKTGVMIGTASDTATIYLDGKPGPKGKITITQGNVQVECDLDVKVTCKGKVTVDATQIEMKAKAGVTIDGGAMVTIKGGIIKLN